MWNLFKRKHKTMLLNASFLNYVDINKVDITNWNEFCNVKLKRNHLLVHTFDFDGNSRVNKTWLFDKWFQDYKKGDFILFKRHDGKIKISKVECLGKLPFEPDIFDGSETPGIGYEMVAKLIKELKHDK